MVEVFKTNVMDRDQANILVNTICKTFYGYTANFDLGDCDKILRVKSVTGVIAAAELIRLLRDLGFSAEVLPDEIPRGKISKS